MKASKFTDAQKAFIIKQTEDGMPVGEAWETDGQCVHRGVQRQVPRGMPEQPLVHEPCRRGKKNGGFDHDADEYRCPGGQVLKPYWRNISKGRPEFGKDGCKKYFAQKQDCAACPLKPRCTPNQATRKIARSRHENARQ